MRSRTRKGKKAQNRYLTKIKEEERRWLVGPVKGPSLETAGTNTQGPQITTNLARGQGFFPPPQGLPRLELGTVVSASKMFPPSSNKFSFNVVRGKKRKGSKKRKRSSKKRKRSKKRR